MLKIFRRRAAVDAAPEAITTPAALEPAAAEAPAVIQFRTRGGAVVDLYPIRFVTRWLGGPPFAADKPYEIDGFQWKCNGCDAYGREGNDYDDPCYRTKREAREDACEHAYGCFAMPRSPWGDA